MKKKILVFTDAFSGGGAEEVMNFFSDNLAEEYEVIHIVKWLGPKQINLPKWKVSLNKKSSKACFYSLKRRTKQFKPDVILTSTAHNNIIILLLKLLYFKNIKIIIRESSVASIMNTYTFKSRIINSYLIRPLYRKADRIIVQSQDMHDDLVNKYQLDSNKLVIINNPLLGDIKKVKPIIKRDDSEIKLVNIGRISKEKGQRRLLDILSKLPENYTLDILGDGGQMENVKDYAKQRGVLERVNFLGFLHEEEKINVLNAADLYIQTSFVEGFPNSLLQALSLGVPVIAYNVLGGTKEIINEKNGFLIDDGDETKMINTIKEINWRNHFDANDIINDTKLRFDSGEIMLKLKQLIRYELE